MNAMMLVKLCDCPTHYSESCFLRYHYGAPSDYDEWAALQKGQTGANEWSYKEFHPYVHPHPTLTIFLTPTTLLTT